MTGGILSFGIALLEHLRSSPLAASSFAFVGFSAWLVGAYSAWSDEHRRLEQAQNKIEELTWPDDRPVIRFIRWSKNPNGSVQRGFFLANSGGVALEARVEDFKIGSDEWTSNPVPGIDGGQEAFAAVWKVKEKQFTRFDLKTDMTDTLTYGPDLAVPVSVVYRDARSLWYRGRSKLTFIKTQDRLEFGPTIIEKANPPQEFGLRTKS
jgi:hypothetical protein